MKRLLIPLVCLLALLGTGLWLLVRRRPVEIPPTETQATFRSEPFGSGLLIRYDDGQTPLRALRWLPPTRGGMQPVQVLTQSDRQRFLLFKDGAMISNLAVPRPAGVREGFFNFAELRDVIVVPGDVAVLLYRSADASTAELPLVIALDLSTQELRWVHRASGERLAFGGDGSESSVFLFGTGSPILRLPTPLRKGEQIGSTPFRPGVKALEMPEEIKELGDLLPTGARSFLAAHTGGLSSYSEAKGWKHWQPQEVASLAFPDFRPILAGSGRTYWWQPFPGAVTQVKADGTTIATYDSVALTPPEPWDRDGRLMSLKGVDPSGNLWFTLATPAELSPVATPGEPPAQPNKAPGSLDDPGKALAPDPTATEPAPARDEQWITYVAKGLDRLYRWNPENRALSGTTLMDFWAALPLPQSLNRPKDFPIFAPESGHLLLESGSTAWLVPLESLPLKSGGPAGKAQAR